METSTLSKCPSLLHSKHSNLLEFKAEAAIKRNQIKAFINAGNGSADPNLTETNENAHLSDHLLHLKTSCSEVKKDIQKKEAEQFKIKDQTTFASEKVKTLQMERGQIEEEIEKLRGILSEVKLKTQSAFHSLKSYEHILDRMKKDEITKQLKRNQLERQLKTSEKKYSDLDAKVCQLSQMQFLSLNGLQEAAGQVEEQNSDRQKKLENIHCVLEEKQVLEHKKQERSKKTDMIKEMAAGDLQDADLIRMRKFLSVQTFIKCVLKTKIQNLKSFYQPYEEAFLKIKSSTSIKDACSIKSEFFNFESSYNDKTAWVKHLEEEIAELEEQEGILKGKLQAAKDAELDILQNLQRNEGKSDHKDKKDFLEAAGACELKALRIRQWLMTQKRRMHLQCDGPDAQILKAICAKLLLGPAPKLQKCAGCIQEPPLA